MSSIPIVQGEEIHPGAGGGNAGDAPPPVVTLYSEADLRKLRANPVKKYQDAAWAILFVVHLLLIVGLIVTNAASNAYSGQEGGGGRGTLRGDICFLVAVTGLVGVAGASCCVSMMMRHTEQLVQTALVFSVGFSGILGVLGILSGNWILAVVGLVSFAMGVCYARAVWPSGRIPFAAQNLKTALVAIHQNMGLTVIAFSFTFLAFLWTVAWFVGLGGAISTSNFFVVFLFFLSYYWVHQVMQNTVHVTTAGTVATWWFVPDEATQFWSKGLTDSFVRATTFSFGSICFGSLLVAIVQALRALEHQVRSNDDFQFVLCCIQCILACIQSILEYLNKWAYVYVAIYGFSYIEAGQNVMNLFTKKGWTVLITDDLADNVLFMISITIGLVSGLCGLALGTINSHMLEGLGYEYAAVPGFVIGFLTGFLFASVIMSVVASAVSTVIVCYAEDPASFQMNHPQLSVEMRTAWVQAFPNLAM